MARRYRYAFAKKREAAKGKWSVGLAAASPRAVYCGSCACTFS